MNKFLRYFIIITQSTFMIFMSVYRFISSDISKPVPQNDFWMYVFLMICLVLTIVIVQILSRKGDLK